MRIIYLLGLIAGIYFASFAAQGIFDTVGIPIDLSAASGVGQIIHYLIVLICAYLFTTLVWRQSVIGFFLLYLQNWRKALRGFLFCAGLAFVVAFLWYVFVLSMGEARWSSAAWTQTGAYAMAKLFFTGLIAIVLATTEEILFRSLAFKYLLSSTTKWAVFRAMFVSSIVFALAHHFDDPTEWLEIKTVGLLIGLTLLGCLLALVYYMTNSLACAIGAHTGLIWIALAKKTQIIQIAPSGWAISNSFDPRTEPAAWMLFILLAVLFWSLRHWLKKTFEIENISPAADAATFTQPRIDAAERPEHEHPVMRRDWLVAMVIGAACIAGFFVTQNLIEHQRQADAKNYPMAVDAFKTGVSRDASVAAAASTAGFRPADYIRVNIEALRRLANGRVEFSGWAADMPGDGSPLVIVVFAGNMTVLQVQTDGAREDVARAFMLSDAAARNVKFNGSFSCHASEPLIVVVTTISKTYFLIPVSITCP